MAESLEQRAEQIAAELTQYPKQRAMFAAVILSALTEVREEARRETKAGLPGSDGPKSRGDGAPVAATCDCGEVLTECYSCALADWQAAHPECRTCCPVVGDNRKA